MKPVTSLGCACFLFASLTWLRASAVDAADDTFRARSTRKLSAIAGDCGACHTAPGGKMLAGGLPLATPFGPIYSTNITPSKTYGIGNYTLAQFADALRKGVRSDGAYLYPGMPYTSYAVLSDDDVKALYSYFMNKVVAVDSPAPETKLPFPFNIRLSMAGWNLLSSTKGPSRPTQARVRNGIAAPIWFVVLPIAESAIRHATSLWLSSPHATWAGPSSTVGMHPTSRPIKPAASAGGAKRMSSVICARAVPREPS